MAVGNQLAGAWETPGYFASGSTQQFLQEHGKAGGIDKRFHQLRLSTEQHARVSIIAPGRGSIKRSQLRHHLSKKEERDGSLRSAE